jgi:hypothetical protein
MALAPESLLKGMVFLLLVVTGAIIVDRGEIANLADLEVVGNGWVGVPAPLRW